MKSSLWFETSMLVLVLVAAVAGSLANGALRHHGTASMESVQPQRLASGS